MSVKGAPGGQMHIDITGLYVFEISRLSNEETPSVLTLNWDN